MKGNLIKAKINCIRTRLNIVVNNHNDWLFCAMNRVRKTNWHSHYAIENKILKQVWVKKSWWSRSASCAELPIPVASAQCNTKKLKTKSKITQFQKRLGNESLESKHKNFDERLILQFFICIHLIGRFITVQLIKKLFYEIVQRIHNKPPQSKNPTKSVYLLHCKRFFDINLFC